MYQDAAGRTKCKMYDDVVTVSHLDEYLAVTETHVTNTFALAELQPAVFAVPKGRTATSTRARSAWSTELTAQATTPASPATTA